MLAHIAGVPVEETMLSMAPVAAAVIGVAGVHMRSVLRRSASPAGSKETKHREGPR